MPEMLLCKVDFPAVLQYLDCLTDHFYGSILVMMHRVFEQVCVTTTHHAIGLLLGRNCQSATPP